MLVIHLALLAAIAFGMVGCNKEKEKEKEPANQAILYDMELNSNTVAPELELNGAGTYLEDGLHLTVTDSVVKLNKFYALGERVVKYHVQFSPDATAIFRSSHNDFQLFVDVPAKKVSVATNPATEQEVAFLEGEREYILEIYHLYQVAVIRLVDIQTEEVSEIRVEHDGQGGVGEGALQAGFNVGMQWDHYCFGLVQGSSMLIKRVTVSSMKDKVKLLLYGDSITQPEGYFPKKDFHKSWTQMIITNLKGNAMSSGRGGGTINTVLEYIKNELPYVEAEYVMVTVGTNGGNTEDNLTELVNYIKANGAIPILNNIPCNESGTQVENNELIERVRAKTGIKGCLFDLVTSVDGDGKTVDKSMMYWEDYSGSYGWQIYHHPNEKGGAAMFARTLMDIPAIYE